MFEKLLNIIMKFRNRKYIGEICGILLQGIYLIDIPSSVVINLNIKLVHNAPGLVIYPNCKIGSNVRIYQGVTIGRANI